MDRLLILMRHAKAVDRMEADDDFERGLTSRGRSDSDAAAQALANLGLAVDLALVSPSWRTRQTYERLVPTLGEPALEDPMALYHASTDMLERAALDAFQRADRILILGHNPGIGSFAHKLAMRAGAQGVMPPGYPTAAAAAFNLPEPGLDRAELAGFYNPKA